MLPVQIILIARNEYSFSFSRFFFRQVTRSNEKWPRTHDKLEHVRKKLRKYLKKLWLMFVPLFLPWLERELPAGLDQKLMTWETVQKENYLAKLEHEHRESSAERLRYTSSKWVTRRCVVSGANLCWMSVCITILTLYRVQSLLRMVGGFKDQEKRMATVETEVKWRSSCWLHVLRCVI